MAFHIGETMNNPVDIQTSNEGTLIGFAPLTEAGEDWLAENVPDAQCLGSIRYCEPRYAAPIIEGMQEDGLIVV
jgi:hypothetical protein